MRGQTEFNEAWMQPGGAYGHKAPESSRVSRTFKSGRVEIRTKGLDRCMVKVVRVTPRSWEVHLADGGRVVAYIKAHTGKGTSYSYRLVSDSKPHGGFASLKACTARILEKI